MSVFHYNDLRDFLTMLESSQDLIKIKEPVSPFLEMTEISRRVLEREGPALLFENINSPRCHSMPVLTNLFGTSSRVMKAMGTNSFAGLRDIGRTLAQLKSPEPPQGWKELWDKMPLLKQLLQMQPKLVKKAPCQTIVLEGSDVDLSILPAQTCWPDDAGAQISWGLVVTKGPRKKRQNLGIYRQQIIGKNKVIMRWLAHRGGALDYRDFLEQNPNKPFPISVVVGADPATLLGAVTPVPDSLSEYQFAGLLRGAKTELVGCLSNSLQVPARSEIVLEGFLRPNEEALEGPFADHTGYYNEADIFPVMTVEKITMRENSIYHSTYTGKPPDEPAVLAVALNEVFVPLLQTQYPEITDFYLPPEGCSYRMAVISIRKQYPGHAKRIMFGIWSFLRQFMYTKFIIITNDDVNIRCWKEVIWAITTRVDAARDIDIIKQTPIDVLDFASPEPGIGAKMGIDATNKVPGETSRTWGQPVVMKKEVIDKIDQIWEKLCL